MKSMGPVSHESQEKELSSDFVPLFDRQEVICVHGVNLAYRVMDQPAARSSAASLFAYALRDPDHSM